VTQITLWDLPKLILPIFGLRHGKFWHWFRSLLRDAVYDTVTCWTGAPEGLQECENRGRVYGHKLWYRSSVRFEWSSSIEKHCPLSWYGNNNGNDTDRLNLCQDPSRTTRTPDVSCTLLVATVIRPQPSWLLEQTVGNARNTARCTLPMDLKFNPCKFEEQRPVTNETLTYVIFLE
jgi:hypothetical protein